MNLQPDHLRPCSRPPDDWRLVAKSDIIEGPFECRRQVLAVTVEAAADGLGLDAAPITGERREGRPGGDRVRADAWPQFAASI